MQASTIWLFDIMWVISCKTPNFGTFQASLWLYSCFRGTSGLLLHKPHVWTGDSLLKQWPSNWRYKMADFRQWVVCVLATPTRKWARLGILSKCSRMIIGQSLPSALVRGSESRIYSHKVRMYVRAYVRGGSRSGMSRRMSLHTIGIQCSKQSTFCFLAQTCV